MISIIVITFIITQNEMITKSSDQNGAFGVSTQLLPTLVNHTCTFENWPFSFLYSPVGTHASGHVRVCAHERDCMGVSAHVYSGTSAKIDRRMTKTGFSSTSTVSTRYNLSVRIES